MKISFFGACREVTGSNILLEAAGKKILLECGMFQGFKLAEERNYAPFAYDPKEIDFVIVCHAHLDHVGRLPKLFKEGFRGKIFSTGPTKDLANLVLEDTEKLMEEESRRDGHPPLYTEEHVAGVVDLFVPVPYYEKLEIAPNIKMTFKNAGHILGSAICVIESDKTLAYTSDLGNNPSLLLPPPDLVEAADVVICESTYGGRVHEDVGMRREKLAQIIGETIKQNGVLLVPSFAVERTQEILHDIDAFCSAAGCEKPTFYLDSPLALRVTEVFEKYKEYFKEDVRSDPDFLGLSRFIQTPTVELSKEINNSPNPKVIIAGSGMMNGGRILHHAEKYLGDSNNSILFVGYQANGTLGRRLFNGEKNVKIFGKNVEVRAQVKSIGSYSAHADMPQIVDWLSKIGGLKKVFLVHGENEQAMKLAKKLESDVHVDVSMPQLGEEDNV